MKHYGADGKEVTDKITAAIAQSLIDASLTGYYTASETDGEIAAAIAGVSPTAENTTAVVTSWAGNLNGVTGNVQAALDALDDMSAAVADGSITLAKMADLVQDKIIGRATASTGVPEAITCTAAGRALLDDATNTDQRSTLGLGTAATAASGDFAAASHNHAAGDINSGTVDTARLGSGTANSTTFLRGDQTWDAPTATVADGSITLAKMADLVQDKFIIRTTGSTGVPETATCTAAGRAILDDASAADQRTTLGLGGAAVLSVGTTAGTVAAGDDSRLSDARTPTAHTHAESDVTNLTTDLSAKEATANKGAASGYCGLDGSTKVAIANLPTGTTSSTVCIGNDARLSDARTPSAHATSHKSGGSDAVKLDELAAPTDVTTLNASTSAHGLLPKLDNVSTNFLNGQGSWAAPTASVSYTLVARLAGDQATGANTTPVTLTGLVFTYAANSTYRIWFCGRVSPAAATTGCGFQFDVSSAVTSIDVIFYHQLANTGTLSGGHSIADDASVGVSSGLPGTSTYPVSGTGLIITTSNTGTAQLRFRSETTAVITCKAGMTLVVEKIA